MVAANFNCHKKEQELWWKCCIKLKWKSWSESSISSEAILGGNKSNRMHRNNLCEVWSKDEEKMGRKGREGVFLSWNMIENKTAFFQTERKEKQKLKQKLKQEQKEDPGCKSFQTVYLWSNWKTLRQSIFHSALSPLSSGFSSFIGSAENLLEHSSRSLSDSQQKKMCLGKGQKRRRKGGEKRRERGREREREREMDGWMEEEIRRSR